MGIARLAANVSAVDAAYSSPSVFTLFPQSCTVEFEGAGVEEIYPESSSTSSIVIFPLGIFSPPLPTAPCLFPNLDQVQPPEPPGRSRQWPQDQLFIMYIGVRILWPRYNYLSLNPLVYSIADFSRFGTYTVASFTCTHTAIKFLRFV